MMASILPLNRWLLAVAAALAVALVALEGGGIEERAVEPLFPTFDGARAVRVEVTAPAASVASPAPAAPGAPSSGSPGASSSSSRPRPPARSWTASWPGWAPCPTSTW